MNQNSMANLLNLIASLPTGLDTKQQLLGLMTSTSQYNPQSLMTNSLPTGPIPPTIPQIIPSVPFNMQSISDSQIEANEYHQINVAQNDTKNICANETFESDHDTFVSDNCNNNSNTNESITSITPSTASPNTIVSDHDVSHTECDSSVNKCLNIKRIIKLELYRNKYAPTEISNTVNKCIEYKNINEDYTHYNKYHSTNDENLKIDQMSKQYEKIYQFIVNFNKGTNKLNPSNSDSITMDEIKYLDKTMDKIYDGMQANSDLNSIEIDMIRAIDTMDTIKKECDDTNDIIGKQMENSISSGVPKDTMDTTDATETITYTTTHKYANIINNMIPKLTPAVLGKSVAPKLPTYNPSDITANHKPLSIPKLQAVTPQNHSFFKNTPKPMLKNLYQVLDLTLRIVPQKNELEYKHIFCCYCNKRYEGREEYLHHLESHRSDKPYKCSFCEKPFRLRHIWAEHLRTHTGQKPYGCTDCKKSFTQASGLTSHIKRYHNQHQNENDVAMDKLNK